jgi:hypothetical protein
VIKVSVNSGTIRSETATACCARLTIDVTGIAHLRTFVFNLAKSLK